MMDTFAPTVYQVVRYRQEGEAPPRKTKSLSVYLQMVGGGGGCLRFNDSLDDGQANFPDFGSVKSLLRCVKLWDAVLR